MRLVLALAFLQLWCCIDRSVALSSIPGAAYVASLGRRGAQAAAAAGAALPPPAPVVYGFSVADGHIAPHQPNWRGYDWGVLTHMAWNANSDYIAAAHQAGRKFEMNAGVNDPNIFLRADRRRSWVARTVSKAVNMSADGINFDYEGPEALGSEVAAAYTALVAETAEALRQAIPGCTISVDVAWSPYDIDGRNFDWTGLAAAADWLFVMAYDTQSQMFTRCVGSANTPYDSAQRAVRQYLALGIPPSKLVLGLPWYGYDYACQPGPDGKPAPPDVDVCLMASVPFRGVACSDAAGAQRNYDYIVQLLLDGRNATPVRWDDMQQAPFFNYVDDRGHTRQVWYDNPRSLASKYQIAVEHRLRGIGTWNLDALDYFSPDPRMREATKGVWAALGAAARRLRPEAPTASVS